MIEVQLHPGMVYVSLLMIVILFVISFQLLRIGQQLHNIETMLSSIRNRL